LETIYNASRSSDWENTEEDENREFFFLFWTPIPNGTTAALIHPEKLVTTRLFGLPCITRYTIV
jgi:hypothetical protein